MTGTPWMAQAQTMRMWQRTLDITNADCKFSPREGDLPAYYSFVEEVCWLHDLAEVGGYVIPWFVLPYMALVSAAPSNWEFISCDILDP